LEDLIKFKNNENQTEKQNNLKIVTDNTQYKKEIEQYKKEIENYKKEIKKSNITDNSFNTTISVLQKENETLSKKISQMENDNTIKINELTAKYNGEIKILKSQNEHLSNMIKKNESKNINILDHVTTNDLIKEKLKKINDNDNYKLVLEKIYENNGNHDSNQYKFKDIFKNIFDDIQGNIDNSDVELNLTKLNTNNAFKNHLEFYKNLMRNYDNLQKSVDFLKSTNKNKLTYNEGINFFNNLPPEVFKNRSNIRNTTNSLSSKFAYLRGFIYNNNNNNNNNNIFNDFFIDFLKSFNTNTITINNNNNTIDDKNTNTNEDRSRSPLKTETRSSRSKTKNLDTNHIPENIEIRSRQ
jgi:hypothetical protein